MSNFKLWVDSGKPAPAAGSLAQNFDAQSNPKPFGSANTPFSDPILAPSAFKDRLFQEVTLSLRKSFEHFQSQQKEAETDFSKGWMQLLSYFQFRTLILLLCRRQLPRLAS